MGDGRKEGKEEERGGERRCGAVESNEGLSPRTAQLGNKYGPAELTES